MFQSEVKQLRLLTKKQAIKQKGYSIIELSIALAIISIILVTSLAGVQRVLRSNNVNNDLRNINLLAATNGTRDIGLMQINSAWLPVLQQHGLQEQDLYDPCVNVLVGAWILSNNFQKLGYTTQGLGAYNAATPWKRERYARQILQSFGY